VPEETVNEQETAELRRRLAALEQERAESIAQAHSALAAAQDRAYWLDRWGLDLNAAMRRPGAARVRLALRALRGALRAAIGVKRRAQTLPGHWGGILKDIHDETATAHIPASADALATAGASMEAGMRCLNFGSSQAVRALAAAHPDCEWEACEPSMEAPLPYEDETFDRVFAISISPQPSAAGATAWLDEMRRVAKPGGALLLTAQGFEAFLTPGWRMTPVEDNQDDLYVLYRR